MLDITSELIRVAVKGDKTINQNTRAKIFTFLRDPEQKPTAEVNGKQPRIHSREQVAAILGGKSPRYIDLLCRNGFLKKFTPKGHKRALGVTAESLDRFLESGN